MSNKQIVIDLLDHLPDNVSLKEIAQRVEFVDGIQEGFAQLDRGEFVTDEEMRAQVKKWAYEK